MSTLAWSPSLALGLAAMDATHQEFVVLLADCEEARARTEAELLAAWRTLVEHTEAHFAQEDRWMADTGFAPENCHSFQHQAVLQVMRECSRRAADLGQFEPITLAIGELASWFPQHAQMMDAALAGHIASLGYDPATGRCASEPAAEAITGCGTTACA